MVLDNQEDRIDELFQETPDIVALCQNQEHIKSEQLQVFGKDSSLYDIWGQIVVGYLPFPREQGQRKMALTIQAVRCITMGRPCLRLNLIGRIDGKTDLVSHLKTNPDPELDGLFSAARQKLEELERKIRFQPQSSRKRNSPDHVLPILRRLARGIERTFRRRRRRTRHAMKRRSERPAVGMALKDIKKATAERFLYDQQHHTFVVLGPKWRVHVFGFDGRHITSMVLDKEGVQKRVDLRRWRYANPEELRDLKAKVAGFNIHSVSGDSS
jgi:hypothetical protein